MHFKLKKKVTPQIEITIFHYITWCYVKHKKKIVKEKSMW